MSLHCRDVHRTVGGAVDFLKSLRGRYFKDFLLLLSIQNFAVIVTEIPVVVGVSK
jgi:hypothetical protein